MPPGHRKPSTILKLKKALYSLRVSPLLWKRELTSTLTSLGFNQVSQEPCIMIRNGIIVFFYAGSDSYSHRSRTKIVSAHRAGKLATTDTERQHKRVATSRVGLVTGLSRPDKRPTVACGWRQTRFATSTSAVEVLFSEPVVIRSHSSPERFD